MKIRTKIKVNGKEEEVFDSRTHCENLIDACPQMRVLQGACSLFDVILMMCDPYNFFEKCDECKEAYQKEFLKRQAGRA